MVKTGVIHAACRNTLFCCLVTASGQMICLLFIRPGETVKTVTDFILGGSKIIANGDCSHEIKRRLLLGRKPSQHIKKQRHYFANKGPSGQSYSFSSSHVWMWEMDYKECWVLKNWCFWTMALEKTLESPLDNKIKTVNLKGYQSWIFIERTDTEAETAILWSPDAKN